VSLLAIAKDASSRRRTALLHGRGKPTAVVGNDTRRRTHAWPEDFNDFQCALLCGVMVGPESGTNSGRMALNRHRSQPGRKNVNEAFFFFRRPNCCTAGAMYVIVADQDCLVSPSPFMPVAQPFTTTYLTCGQWELPSVGFSNANRGSSNRGGILPSRG